MLIEILTIAGAIASISSSCLLFFIAFKIKELFNSIKMNAEELLGNIDLPKEETHDQKRERLSAVIAGGGGKQYLGREIQLTDIDSMSSEEVNKLFCRYEARLGASMTKTLANSMINLYALGVSKVFPVANPPQLIDDLTEDPFVNNALTTVCCEMYYKYGMYLAPLTAMLTTVKHIDFQKNNNTEVKDGEQRGDDTSC